MGALQRSAGRGPLLAAVGLVLWLVTGLVFGAAAAEQDGDQPGPVSLTWQPADLDRGNFQRLAKRLDRQARLMMALDKNCKTLGAVLIDQTNRDDFLPDPDEVMEQWQMRTRNLQSDFSVKCKTTITSATDWWVALKPVGNSVPEACNPNVSSTVEKIERSSCELDGDIHAIAILINKLRPILLLTGQDVRNMFPSEIPASFLARVSSTAPSTCAPVTPTPCRAPRKATQVLVNGKYSCLCL